ncbi:hypothetical protein EV421DRAFT_1907905 [Armillaria borealis]|uniref:Glucose-methanol-choline oxidoreductase N-terminal domain-containing protein n=1 Tax=Armillaria borealis TaxID=47425 RepID=A0AA39J726_9AGAR|nr:hypothetical protein EV421DRAFT_1907905 [Armillaria borealis]
MGIEVVVDNPGVGSNLKDHVDVPVMWNIPLNESLHVIVEEPMRAIFELAKHLISGRSILSEPFAHLAIFLPSRLLNENMEIVTPAPSDLDSTFPQNGPDLEIKPMPIYGLDPPPNATTIHVKEGVMDFMPHWMVLANHAKEQERGMILETGEQATKVGVTHYRHPLM